jgi:hypothetical protein
MPSPTQTATTFFIERIVQPVQSAWQIYCISAVSSGSALNEESIIVFSFNGEPQLPDRAAGKVYYSKGHRAPKRLMEPQVPGNAGDGSGSRWSLLQVSTLAPCHRLRRLPPLSLSNA